MKYILSIVAAVAALVLLLEPAVIGEAVRYSVNICLEVMVPSLFAFTVLAVYLQESGLYRVMLKPFTLPLSKLMGLEEELCAVYLLSNIGGYPVGAKLLTRFVESGRLSQNDASRMLCFCYGSGPSFIISIVGLRVFDSAAAGIVIFAACFLSSFVIGIIVSRCGKHIQLSPDDTAFDLSSACFVTSVMSAARVMFTVCIMIVCFSAITSIVEITGVISLAETLFSLIGANENAANILPILMEISCIQRLIPSNSLTAALSATMLSFGGVCVIMQIKAISEARISLKPFLLSRIPAMLLSGTLTAFAAPFINTVVQNEYIPTSSSIQTDVFSVNAGMSLCVLMMCGMLLTFSHEK